jgi:16S rRNA (guanine527-N7)-methyltransferase
MRPGPGGCRLCLETMMDILASGASTLGLPLGPDQLQRFKEYGDLLLQWNRRFNLTSIESPEDVEVKHFLDSLTAVLALRQERGFPDDFRLLDIGSGAGFPGIPLRIALPGLQVALLEATGKKVVFLQHAVEALGLSGVEALQGRAEELAHDAALRESFDAVVARAVAPLAVLCELGLPFVRHDGLFVAMKKGDTAAEVRSASKALAVLGGRLEERIDVRMARLDDARHLIRVRKIAPSPAGYPRRPGMPAKSPL